MIKTRYIFNSRISSISAEYISITNFLPLVVLILKGSLFRETCINIFLVVRHENLRFC